MLLVWAVVSESSTGAGFASKLTHMDIVRISSSPAIGLKTSVLWLLFGQRPPSVPSHMALTVGQLTTLQLASCRENRKEHSVFYTQSLK